MKVRELLHIMNDHGTKPRIRIIKHHSDYSGVVYEGRLDHYDAGFSDHKVNSFTALGKGFIEIHI